MAKIEKIYSSDTLNTGREKINTAIDALVNSSGNIVNVGFTESFDTLAALKSKYPSGRDGMFFVFDNGNSDGGHSYIWSENAWKDLGIYQAEGIADKSITSKKIDADTLDLNISPDLKKIYNPQSEYDISTWYKLNDLNIAKTIRIINRAVSGHVFISIRGSAFVDSVATLYLVRREWMGDKYTTTIIDKIQPPELQSTAEKLVTIDTSWYIDQTSGDVTYHVGISDFGFYYKQHSQIPTAEGWYEWYNTGYLVERTLSFMSNRAIDITIACNDTKSSMTTTKIDWMGGDFVGGMSHSPNGNIYIYASQLPVGTKKILLANQTIEDNGYLNLYYKTSEQFKLLWSKKLEKVESLNWEIIELPFAISGENYHVGLYNAQAYYNDSIDGAGRGHYDMQNTRNVPNTSITITNLNFIPNTLLYLVPIIDTQSKDVGVANAVANMFSGTQKEEEEDSKNFNISSVIRKMRSGQAVKISCYGDSTYYGHKSGAIPLGTRTDQPAPALLQKMLRNYYNNDSITVVNNATNGRQASNDTGNWSTTMQSDTADLIFINFGINDANSGKSAGTFYNEMTTLVSGAQKAGKCVVIETANQVLSLDKGSQGMGSYTKAQNIKEFVEISRFVSKKQDVYLLDSYKNSSKYLSWIGNPTIAFPDGMHPSDELYKYKAAQMAGIFTNTSDNYLVKGDVASSIDAIFTSYSATYSTDDMSPTGVKMTTAACSISVKMTKGTLNILCNGSVSISLDGEDAKDYVPDKNKITIGNLPYGNHILSVVSSTPVDVYGLSVE